MSNGYFSSEISSKPKTENSPKTMVRVKCMELIEIGIMKNFSIYNEWRMKLKAIEAPQKEKPMLH